MPRITSGGSDFFPQFATVTITYNMPCHAPFSFLIRVCGPIDFSGGFCFVFLTLPRRPSVIPDLGNGFQQRGRTPIERAGCRWPCVFLCQAALKTLKTVTAHYATASAWLRWLYFVVLSALAYRDAQPVFFASRACKRVRYL